MSEAELVAGLRADDVEARDLLYRRYARMVWSILKRMLGHDRDLEDVHHEVFVQAIRSARRFRHDAPLKTWLYGIAVNCVRSKLRSRSRKRWLFFLAPEDLPEPTTDPDDETVAQVTAVYRLVERMQADDRITFTLRFVERMTLDEIADVCAVSTGTVKRRLRRARSRFLKLAAGDPHLRQLCGGDDG